MNWHAFLVDRIVEELDIFLVEVPQTPPQAQAQVSAERLQRLLPLLALSGETFAAGAVTRRVMRWHLAGEPAQQAESLVRAALHEVALAREILDSLPEEGEDPRQVALAHAAAQAAAFSVAAVASPKYAAAAASAAASCARLHGELHSPAEGERARLAHWKAEAKALGLPTLKNYSLHREARRQAVLPSEQQLVAMARLNAETR